MEIAKSLYVTVAGCYRPPSATKKALSKLNYKELLMCRDLKWNWLNAVSVEFKSFCDSINLRQLVNLPTRLNVRSPEKSTLTDLVLTNIPQKIPSLDVFSNDLSNHCVVATCSNFNIPKCNPQII